MKGQARRQDNVTGRAEINFGGARKVYLCEFERGTGAREICSSLDQMNKVKTKNSEGFSGRKQVISKKKIRSCSVSSNVATSEKLNGSLD